MHPHNAPAKPAPAPTTRKRFGLFKKLLLVLVVVVVGFVGLVLMQPSDYSVTRSATMSAPAAATFEQVNDFHKWDAWSPWAKLDPAMKTTFDGPPAGVGSTYSWIGNGDVGEGKMTITESRPNEHVRIKLEFIKPFASTCDTVFTFKPDGDQTAVTWTMSGHNEFIGKAFCLFMNMDKMIGSDFEKGLADMKKTVEAGAKK